MIFHKKFTNIFSKFVCFFPFWTFTLLLCPFRKCCVLFFTIFIYECALENSKFEHFDALKNKKKSRFASQIDPLFWLFLFKSVNKARNVCRANVSTDHSAPPDQHVCPNRALVALIIFDGERVASDVLSAVF